ncbi:BRAP2 RING ZnF UBP domain-containing protein 2 [Citrus sinensis]|nr:BRAP2 RING ZnF UBP domain-containing protein 2 [Citrus sinensis]
MCVICGFVGCGRYKGGHAIIHWKETEHCYSLELETQRVWDYAGDNYVHRLIQSKTDGKLVELNSHCLHGKDNCGSCDCVDSGTSDALLSSKVEAIVNEYNELLAAQLENQKIYYETLLQEAKEETEKIISEAVKKAIAQKLQKMQAKLDRCVTEKKFLDDLNENLLKNQEMWKAKISEIEEREKMALRAKDDKIQDSEAQLRDLMAYLEAEKTLQQLSISNEIKDGTVLPMSVESSTSTGTKGKGKKIQ